MSREIAAPRGPLEPRPSARSAAAYPPINMNDPEVARQAVQNIHNLYLATPEQTRAVGKEWYDRVHEAVAKGVRRRGMSQWHGAGVVAAVSPSMDWERRNIDAFKELTSLRQQHWDAINRSAAGSGRRTAEAKDVLAGMSISTASDANLVKAHRIMQGEDPDIVLPRRTAPKTNAFAHNINDPQTGGNVVTIDGRAHDIGANRMQPWESSSRGISSASLKTGAKTRYEHFEDAYRSASGLIHELHGVELAPHQLQAVTWEGGKVLERAAPTKSGRPRVKGVTRRGQPYV